METNHPYQVCLYVGPAAPEIEGVKVVNLTPTELTSEAILDAVATSGLSPADLRARVVVMVNGDPKISVAVYSALLGFAGRRLDITDGKQVLIAADLEAGTKALADAGKTDPVPVQIQVGPVLHPDLPSITPETGLSPADVSAIRHAKRVRFVVDPAPSPAIAAVSQLIVLAGLRVKGQGDRLPYLVEGDEPAPSSEDPTAIVGLCLDTVRRQAADLRRSLRFSDRGSLAEKIPLTSRQRTLLAASAVPIEQALQLLGATADETSGLWHCPRPERHTHGDANASMRVTKGKTQCFRCDDERADSLRLVIDTKGFTPEEAADWLLANAISPPLDTPVAV